MLLKNRYRITQLIAEGGFGKTFLAVDEVQSPPSSCVIKQFWLQKQAKIDLNILAGKLNELGKHPQIPALLDFFEADGNFYLVQEFVGGINLAKVVELEGVFNEAQVWNLLNNLLPVLKLIHDNNVIHGDIKPENIIRVENKSGKFVLVGFGNGMGSAEYVAPEQLRGKAVFASDIYSLGVCCFYLLTGVSPFNLSPGIWREYLQDKVSDRLSHILDKLLQNDPQLRFQSADEVLRVMGKKSPILNLKSQITNFSCLQTLTGHGGLFSGVNSVAISPDGKILASGSDDKTIRLWHIETGEVIATLFGHTNFVQSVAFSPDGTILVSGSDDKTIKLWDLQTYQEICTLSEHSRAVKSVIFSPIPPQPPLAKGGQFDPPNPADQKSAVSVGFPLGKGDGRGIFWDGRGIFASGSWDKTIKLWDLEAKKAICTIAGHQLQVTSVSFSPDGRYLASASFDRTVRLWNWQNRELLTHQILSGHSWPVFSVAFSPKGDILATGSGDNTIKLWDFKTGQEIRTILGHSWSVVAVVFSADGETLISGSWDKTVKLWQVSTGKEIDTLAGHLDAVSTVAVSPNGQIIASGSKDKTIKLWRRDA